MLSTKEKGDIALSQAISWYIRSGHEVLLPVGDRKDYDCVVEKDGVLKKVQVKYAGKYADGVCRVGLRITGGNQSRNYTKKYVDDAFDLLFIYTEKGTLFEIPWKHFPYKNELTIEDKKYIKYRLI